MPGLFRSVDVLRFGEDIMFFMGNKVNKNVSPIEHNLLKKIFIKGKTTKNQRGAEGRK
jgi:hypothetical protein